LHEHTYPVLRGAIKEKGYTQRSLAKKMGMSPESFSLKITRKSKFDIVEIEEISRILEKPASIFFA